MATDLSKEFEAGRIARIERQYENACPYLATSAAYNAWHAGYMYELCLYPHKVILGRITAGRGSTVNIAGKDACKAGHPPIKLTAHVEYLGGRIGCTVTFK